jgi:hypothetical protein
MTGIYMDVSSGTSLPEAFGDSKKKMKMYGPGRSRFGRGGELGRRGTEGGKEFCV